MLNIRQEVEGDEKEVYELVKDAFCFTKGLVKGDEYKRVNELKNSSDFIPELSFVAEEDGCLVAYNILTKFNRYSINKNIKALLLGPICVKLEYRNKGIGKKLINKSLETAKKLGYEAVFLFGNETYYKKLGFKQTLFYNIESLNKSIQPENAMVKELVSNVLKDIKGTVSFEF
mgnify:CR=1 FL=1